MLLNFDNINPQSNAPSSAAAAPVGQTNFDDVFAAAEQEYGVPAELLKRQMMAESGGRVDAKSEAGAVGLMQFLPSTAKEIGINPLDPVDAIMGAAYKLRTDADKRYNGDLALAVAAYHGGYDKKGWGPKTLSYVDKIFGQDDFQIIAKQVEEAAAAVTAEAPKEKGLLERFNDFRKERQQAVNDSLDQVGLEQNFGSANANAAQYAQREQKALERKTAAELANKVEGPVSRGEVVSAIADQPRTKSDIARDAALQLVQGTKQIVATPAGLIAPGSNLAQSAQKSIRDTQAQLSNVSKANLEAADIRIKRAAEGGTFEELKAAVAEYGTNPVLLQHFITTTLPSMAAVMAPAKFAQVVAAARGVEGAGLAAVGANTIGAANAAMNAGGARQEAYDSIYQALIQQGVSPEEAKSRAENESLLSAAVGAGTGWFAKYGAEAPLVNAGVNRAIGKGGVIAATKAGAGVVGREVLSEQAEEVLPQDITNSLVSKIDGSNPLAGLPSTAVQTAIAAGPMAAPGAVIESRNAYDPLGAELRGFADAVERTQFTALDLAASGATPSQLANAPITPVEVPNVPTQVAQANDQVPGSVGAGSGRNPGNLSGVGNGGSGNAGASALGGGAGGAVGDAGVRTNAVDVDQQDLLTQIENQYLGETNAATTEQVPEKAVQAQDAQVRQEPAAASAAEGVTNEGGQAPAVQKAPNADQNGVQNQGQVQPESAQATAPVPGAAYRGDVTQGNKVKNRRAVLPESDSALVAIAKLGGMDTQHLLTNGFDESDISYRKGAKVSKKTGQLGKAPLRAKSVGFNMPIHRSGGMSFDGMREALVQYGYLPQDASVNDAIELLRSELRGEPVYTASAQETMAREDNEARQSELAAEQMANDELGLDEEYGSFNRAVDNVAEAVNERDAFIRGMRSAGLTEEEINEATIEAFGNGEVAAGPAEEGAYAGRDARDQEGQADEEAFGGTEGAAPDWLNDEPTVNATNKAETKRGDVGASLTKAERKSVLKTLVDVYKQNRAPKEFKGLDSNGNERYGYAHSPEYFVKSDITGAMVRYYVTLPDGRIAHPTELFADYTQSDIDAALQKQINEDKANEEGKAWRNQQIDSIANQSLQKVRSMRGEQFRKVGKAIPDRLVEFYSEDEGKWFAVEDQDVAKAYRNELRERGYREVATYRNEAGENQPAVWMPKSYVETDFNLAGQTNEQAAAAAKQTEPDITKEQIDRERDAVPFSLATESQPKPVGVQGGLKFSEGESYRDKKPSARAPLFSQKNENSVIANVSGKDVSAEQITPENVIDVIRTYYRNSLRDGDTVTRQGFGTVRFSKKGLDELRYGIKKDLLRAKLLPAVPDIIRDGEYHGREELTHARHDKIVAFHFFSGDVIVDGNRVTAGVTVGEDAFGNLFYNVTHDQSIGWKAREAHLLPRAEASGGEPQTDDRSSVKMSVDQDESNINIFILSSLSEQNRNGQSATAVSDRLRSLFRSPSKFDSIVSVVQSVNDLPDGLRGSVLSQTGDGSTVQGFVHNGKVYLIADNLRQGKELSVFLHELGGHIGMRNMLGESNFNKLIGQINAWAADNSKSLESQIAKLAKRKAEQSSSGNTDEEVLAYFIESAVDSGINPTALKSMEQGGFKQFFTKLMEALRVAMQKIGLGNFDALTSQDIVDLAYGAAGIELGGKDDAESQKFDPDRAHRQMVSRLKLSDEDNPVGFDITVHEQGGTMFNPIPREFTFSTWNGNDGVSLNVSEQNGEYGDVVFSSSLEAYGDQPKGTGIATKMYLSALNVAQKRGIGWMSEGVRSDESLAMYRRLKAAGIPFVEVGNASYISADSLNGVDLQAVADRLGNKRKDTITVDGVERPTLNSNGKPIAQTEEGLRNFWKWFGDSRVVDAKGRPLVVYHGTGRQYGNRGELISGDVEAFDPSLSGKSSKTGAPEGTFFFTNDPEVASSYAVSWRGDFSETYRDNANVMPVYLKIDKPAKANAKGENWRDVLYKGDYLDVNEIAGMVQEAGKNDGVIVSNVKDKGVGKTSGKPANTYVAFNPTQIKSATGNNGDFDGSNPDIRYSQSRNGFTLPEFSKTDQWQERVQDRYNRLRDVIKAVRSQGMVNDLNDFSMGEDRFHGVAMSKIEDVEASVTSLLKGIKAAGVTLDEVTMYAYAEHAPERNAAMQAINPNVTTGSGMSDQEALDIIDKANAEGTGPALAALAAQMRDIAKRTLRQQLDSGLIDQAEYDALTNKYKFWVPLRGFEKIDETGKTFRGAGKGFNIRGKENLRALGRDSKAGQILENIIMDAERTAIRSTKNTEVNHRLLKFIMDNPDANLWEIDANKTKQSMRDGRVSLDSMIDKGDNTIGIKVKGKVIYAKIHDQKLFEQLANMWDDNEFGAIPYLGEIQRYLSKSYTAWSPEFALYTNPARDIQAALVSITGREGIGMTGLFAKNYLAAVKQAYNAEVRGQNSALYDEYVRMGGKTGFWNVSTLQSKKEEIESLIKDMENLSARNVWRTPWKLVKALEKLVSNHAGALEQATRFAAFLAMKEAGRSPQEAGNFAKNLNVNFNRRGTWTSGLGSVFLFFNPSIQGTHNMYVTLTQGKHKEQAWALLGAGVAGMFMLAMMNASAGEDDDGISWWDKVPDYEKRNNIVIVLPPFMKDVGEQIKDSTGRYIKFPMPYGWNVPFYSGALAADVVRHGDDAATGMSAGKAAINLAVSASQSFNPVGIPQAVMPFYQHAANKSAFGDGKLYPENEWNKNKPDSEKYSSAMKGSPWQQWASFVNEMTGGNQYKEGVISIPPTVWRNYARSFIGGPMSFATGVSDAITEGDITKAPFVRKMYGEVGFKNDSAMYYDKMDEAKKVYGAVESAYKAGDFKIADDMWESKKAMYDLGSMVEDYNKSVSASYRHESEIKENTRFSVKEKELALRLNEKKRSDDQEEFLKRWREEVSTKK